MIGISNIGAFIIWGVAFLWFGWMIWYFQQHVNIQIKKCGLRQADSQSLYVDVEGFISARHKDCLSDLQLCLTEDLLSPINSLSIMPQNVDSFFQKFTASYSVPFHMFEEGRKAQKKGQAIDLAIICAALPKSKWVSEPFKIPSGEDEMPSKMKTKKQKNKTCGVTQHITK